MSPAGQEQALLPCAIGNNAGRFATKLSTRHTGAMRACRRYQLLDKRHAKAATAVRRPQRDSCSVPTERHPSVLVLLRAWSALEPQSLTMPVGE